MKKEDFFQLQKEQNQKNRFTKMGVKNYRLFKGSLYLTSNQLQFLQVQIIVVKVP